MPSEGQTALAIPVPAADPLLASVAARFPGVVREGVPSHVSVQYPFLAASELDGEVIGALSELFGGQRPIPVTFATCHRLGGFVYVRPNPIDGLAELAVRVRQRWPEVAPPEGWDGEVGPHLTVAMRASEQTADTIEREVATALPISAELREAWLVTFDGRWALREQFEFGTAR
jgi:2'-5' RNA ligase superfamily